MFVARKSTPPTMSIAMLGMGSAVENNYRKYLYLFPSVSRQKICSLEPGSTRPFTEPDTS